MCYDVLLTVSSSELTLAWALRTSPREYPVWQDQPWNWASVATFLSSQAVILALICCLIWYNPHYMTRVELIDSSFYKRSPRFLITLVSVSGHRDVHFVLASNYFFFEVFNKKKKNKHFMFFPVKSNDFSLTLYDIWHIISASLRILSIFCYKCLRAYTASMPILGSVPNRGITHHLMSCVLMSIYAHDLFSLLKHKLLEANKSISFILFSPMASCSKLILTELIQIQ